MVNQMHRAKGKWYLNGHHIVPTFLRQHLSLPRRFYPSENWFSSKCLTSVITRERVFPSWYKPLLLLNSPVVPDASWVIPWSKCAGMVSLNSFDKLAWTKVRFKSFTLGQSWTEETVVKLVLDGIESGLVTMTSATILISVAEVTRLMKQERYLVNIFNCLFQISHISGKQKTWSWCFFFYYFKFGLWMHLFW